MHPQNHTLLLALLPLSPATTTASPMRSRRMHTPLCFCFLALLSTALFLSSHHISGDTEHRHTHLLLLSRAAFDRTISFTTSHFRRHRTSTYPLALAFSRCFQPHCFHRTALPDGDTGRHAHINAPIPHLCFVVFSRCFLLLSAALFLRMVCCFGYTLERAWLVCCLDRYYQIELLL
jgi:hypothetical protein